MPEYVLDTVALRVMAFADPRGVDILLEAIASSAARFPAEVYNQDEGTLPLEADDEGISELARGLRFARRQADTLPLVRAQRYQTWLENAAQLARHLREGSLLIDPLAVDELPRREDLRRTYGIGRGEAAGLVLVERYGALGVFLSSDAPACKVAQHLGLAYLTLAQVLENWVDRSRPTEEALDALLDGMRAARFGFTEGFVQDLKRRL
ncbi:MAG: hypothetical protein HYY04_15115 [Chloroflexi bacterium]|nr:hypothetical protein [Chloroflexota bacterium]